ncbi:MAG: hypothetical protein ABSC19_17790 [Syntrophorhabdales bacterium]
MKKDEGQMGIVVGDKKHIKKGDSDAWFWEGYLHEEEKRHPAERVFADKKRDELSCCQTGGGSVR